METTTVGNNPVILEQYLEVLETLCFFALNTLYQLIGQIYLAYGSAIPLDKDVEFAIP